MTPEHEKHLNSIRDNLDNNVTKKYTAGQEEHKGKLWEMGLKPLITEVSNEAIDNCVYLYCVRSSVSKIDSLVEEGLAQGTPDYVAKSILAQIRDVLNGKSK